MTPLGSLGRGESGMETRVETGPPRPPVFRADYRRPPGMQMSPGRFSAIVLACAVLIVTVPIAVKMWLG